MIPFICMYITRSSLVRASKNGMFGLCTYRDQTERLKLELFGNGTKSKNAEIRTFGF